MQKQKSSFLNRITGSEEENVEENTAQQSLNSTPIYSGEEDYPQDNLDTPDQDIDVVQENPNEEYSEYEENGEADGQLTIDVYQTNTSIVIKSTIAGVKPEDVDVSISNDMITIKGERKQEENIDEDSYYYQECYWGTFSRSIVLPMDVVTDKIDASLKNGILTIKLPKADTLIAKKIQVRGF
ncbi:MAG: Hsp20/alpha crystallin family protein [Candidatus Moranbacteria bacterium]|nr:Hsp20/alpha crystallin family protein [Candidatus Moranbacteria bacterium]